MPGSHREPPVQPPQKTNLVCKYCGGKLVKRGSFYFHEAGGSYLGTISREQEHPAAPKAREVTDVELPD